MTRPTNDETFDNLIGLTITTENDRVSIILRTNEQTIARQIEHYAVAAVFQRLFNNPVSPTPLKTFDRITTTLLPMPRFMFKNAAGMDTSDETSQLDLDGSRDAPSRLCFARITDNDGLQSLTVSLAEHQLNMIAAVDQSHANNVLPLGSVLLKVFLAQCHMRLFSTAAEPTLGGRLKADTLDTISQYLSLFSPLCITDLYAEATDTIDPPVCENNDPVALLYASRAFYKIALAPLLQIIPSAKAAEAISDLDAAIEFAKQELGLGSMFAMWISRFILSLSNSMRSLMRRQFKGPNNNCSR